MSAIFDDVEPNLTEDVEKRLHKNVLRLRREEIDLVREALNRSFFEYQKGLLLKARRKAMAPFFCTADILASERGPWIAHFGTASGMAIGLGQSVHGRTDDVSLGEQVDSEKEELVNKIRLLEQQLQCDRPYLRLYRLGATSLVVAVLSILMWYFAGVGVPFHPAFAALVIPVAVGLMIMAVLMRPERSDRKEES